MPTSNQLYVSKYRILTPLLITLIIISCVFFVLNINFPAFDQYHSIFPAIIIVLLTALLTHLYIQQLLKSIHHLSCEIRAIKSSSDQQTLQLKITQFESKKQSALIDMLQQANLDFIEHSQLQRTARFMIDQLMHITDSECGFIAEVLKQHDGESKVNILSICHRENQVNFSDNNKNPAHDDNLINKVLTTRQVVIKNSPTSNPEQAGMPSCCSNISNTILIPVFYGTDIVGIYALADCATDYNEGLIEFLQPFSTTYAVLSHAKRSYTEQAIIQENLLLAKLEADQASHAKSEFLSRMSHELRTPLNVILGYSQLLLDEVEYKIDPDVAKCLRNVEQSGQHLLKLINEVLDLSHIESGLLDIDLKPIDLNQVMKESISMVSILTKLNNIQVDYEETDFAHINVQSDRLRLLQVLVNLLSNAIKYNKNQGKVLISGHCKNNIFIISIKDTGIGIPKDKQNKLFVAFDRLGAESSGIEGTGIGLPITKKLIEIMGGQLKLESEVNNGSTFHVYLNLELPANLVINKQVTKDTIHLQALEQGTHTILYIEDNKDNTELVRRILGRYASIHLFTAEDGLSGLQLAARISADIILLDMQLPDTNGFEVFRKLRANKETANTPVLGVSANAMPVDINNALAAGFDNYITKPINIRIFLEAIDDTLVSLNKSH